MRTVKLNHHEKEALEAALGRQGLRSTKQREHVFAVLLAQRDHPTVDDVYIRSQEGMPAISLATVYNCLEALVGCGLVKQVNIEREPSRYCPNLAEHAHFHCLDDGKVYDIPLPVELATQLRTILPQGYAVESLEIAFHGHKNTLNYVVT